jgi:alanyl-tRNA synthetase
LDCTAFYPTSGGQPHDLGSLGPAQVLEVRDEREEIVHVVDRPLEPGPIHGSIQWARRFDHMQQHTGQHLLSAIVQTRFALPTVSFHLGTDTSTIDLRGAGPSEEVLQQAEHAANEIVFQDRSICIRYGTAEEFARLGIRKDVDRAGILRAIEIDSVDLQPCGGTHVNRTGQIGTILVRRCSKVRQDWRVEFVCGTRAERVARQDFVRLRSVADQLSCAPDDVISATQRLIAERDANFKDARATMQKLAEAEAALAIQATPPGPAGMRVIARVLPEDAQTEYFAYLAAACAKADKTIALLAGAGGHVIFAQHPFAGSDMNGLLKQVMQLFRGKGGGTRDLARGRLTDPFKPEEALTRAVELLTSLATERTG